MRIPLKGVSAEDVNLAPSNRVTSAGLKLESVRLANFVAAEDRSVCFQIPFRTPERCIFYRVDVDWDQGDKTE